MKRIVLIFIAGLYTACPGSNQSAVRSDQFGDEWPFPGYESAVLKCNNKSFGGINRPIVTITLGETEYGLNGAAIGMGGYQDAKVKMAKSEWGTIKLGATSNLIQIGLELCQ